MGRVLGTTLQGLVEVRYQVGNRPSFIFEVVGFTRKGPREVLSFSTQFSE